MSLVCLDLLPPVFSLAHSNRFVPFYGIGTLKHAQMAAIEWNRQIIARVKSGMDVSCTLFICCYHNLGVIDHPH